MKYEHDADQFAPINKLNKRKVSPLETMWSTGSLHCVSFEKMKRVLSREVLLAYPNFSKIFVIHLEASDYHIGTVIIQDGKPITIYFQKMNNTQTYYTTTKKELLAILDTLKELKKLS